ncbi:MAG: hypothetical protein ACREV5_21810, partial [Steroidobacter sp.]
MSSRILKTFVALACFAAATNSFADCAADATLDETRAAYNKGLQLESAGKTGDAFYAFVAAQEYTCETNPVELDAARRAAALALQLGGLAEKKGAFEKAFDIYDAGGHYASADRALIALVRAKPDMPQVYEKARQAFSYRTLPAFQSNNKTRLGVAGAYRPNSKDVAEVLAMPVKGAERAFQKEAAAFNEQYLREFVEMTQATPDDPTDFDAMQAAMARHQTFARKWKSDPLKNSRDALSLARTWASSTSLEDAEREKIEARRKQVIEQHVATLTKNYSGAPKLLELAIDYQLSIHIDDAVKQQRAAAIRSQAGKLGDELSARQRYGLAAEYYSVAKQDAKAQAVRDQQQQLAMARMQPSMDAMQKQAEEMQKQFSDPAKVKA